MRGAFIYLFSSLLELYSRRKKLQKKRNNPLFYRSSRIFRSFPIIFKPRLPFSPDWVRVFVSRPSSSSFFLSYLQTSKKKERSARVGRKEYVRNFFSEITYGTNKRSGMRANKVAFRSRSVWRENIYTKGSVFPMQHDLCVLFPCSDHFRRKEKLLFSTIK